MNEENEDVEETGDEQETKQAGWRPSYREFSKCISIGVPAPDQIIGDERNFAHFVKKHMIEIAEDYDRDPTEMMQCIRNVAAHYKLHIVLEVKLGKAGLARLIEELI